MRFRPTQKLFAWVSSLNLWRPVDWSAFNAIEQILSLLGGGESEETLLEFQSNGSVPKDSETAILTYNVPAGKTLRIIGWKAWANRDAEYFLRIAGTQKDGHRTSTASPTAGSEHFPASITAASEESVTISALYSTGSPNQPFNAVLKGLLNG